MNKLDLKITGSKTFFATSTVSETMNASIITLAVAMILLSCQSRQEVKAQEFERGRKVYAMYCKSCHHENGEGVPGLYPSLRKNTIIMDAQTHKFVRLIRYRAKSRGRNSVPLTSREIAEVVNYIQNSWGNKARPVSQSQVEAILINKPW